MKIAIPVKMKRENPPLAPLFGKAKWFAMVEGDTVEIVENPAQGGRAVVEWFLSEGVNAVIFQKMGMVPYEIIKASGSIDLFHAGYERVLLNDVLEKFNAGELLEIDDTNVNSIIAHHEGKHSHGEKH
ncbi:NifB/NifX family molybdenum-iron cluster-binding protein [Sulfurovum sp.]|uniref:NifB/NifX family molybdenum-iron cluster-binding protein n=1 Tax=Sulfurovum sp. TaxID=1969726 RepID=UPI0025FB5876|nr:NifB/NifX family molybdenum-iron cluster-binding protein [Sulfurovum sp.]